MLAKRSRLRAFSASICCCACCDAGARLQPADHRPAVAVPRVVGPLLGGEGQRHPEIDVGGHEVEVARHDADDLVRDGR